MNSGDAVFGGVTLEVVENVEGMRVAIPWHPKTRRDLAPDFLEEAKNLWGIEDGINWPCAAIACCQAPRCKDL